MDKPKQVSIYFVESRHSWFLVKCDNIGIAWQCGVDKFKSVRTARLATNEDIAEYKRLGYEIMEVK